MTEVEKYKGVYKPVEKSKAYMLSRSKIELFCTCPRCFYLDRKMAIKRPDGPPFRINQAVDELLKKEFDVHRLAGTSHPIQLEHKLGLIPFMHPSMEEWRSNFKGIGYLMEEQHFWIYGAVDDIWVNPKTDELHVVDYKATSKNSEVSIDEEWQKSYKRQVEVYQWLLRKNGFKVSDTAYFVYCNGDSSRPSFDGKVHFSTKLIPYVGKADWIEGIVDLMWHCLQDETAPPIKETCVYCSYLEVYAKWREDQQA